MNIAHKKYKYLLGILLFLLSHAGTGRTTPLNDILSFFKQELHLTLTCSDHKNLVQGSRVYLVEDLSRDKVEIGKVTAIDLSDTPTTRVEIAIGKTHKEKLFDTTAFVLVSPPFSETNHSYILAVPQTAGPGTLLSSGDVIEGIPFLEYKIFKARDSLEKMMEDLKDQNAELFNQLDTYVKNFDTQAFAQRLSALADQISRFSDQQKETFKNQVLPGLKKALESMMEELEKQNNTDKSKELEEQFLEIENLVDV